MKQEHFEARAASSGPHHARHRAIAFPTFVADLIKGTFQAIVNASIQQMEAYGKLLSNVAKTVDQFMADNISDNNARDWLANAYPEATSRSTPAATAPRWRCATASARPPSRTSAARWAWTRTSTCRTRRPRRSWCRPRAATWPRAATRCSTMMLMGINRIVITSGRIYARMGFQINAQDLAQAESASQFDAKHESTVHFGGGIANFFGGPAARRPPAWPTSLPRRPTAATPSTSTPTSRARST